MSTGPNSTKILISVGLALMITLIPLFGWIAKNEKSEIISLAQRQASTMLEAVHVNRRQLEDNDPATDILNGWLVMGQKIMDHQIKNGQKEIEGPLDDIDQEVLDTGAAVTRLLPNNTLRITRPVIMGQGSASDGKCLQCHSYVMGINYGETFGACGVAVDYERRSDQISGKIF